MGRGHRGDLYTGSSYQVGRGHKDTYIQAGIRTWGHGELCESRSRSTPFGTPGYSPLLNLPISPQVDGGASGAPEAVHRRPVYSGRQEGSEGTHPETHRRHAQRSHPRQPPGDGGDNRAEL